VKSPEELAALRSAQQQFSELAKHAVANKDFGSALHFGSKAQAFREAYEAATDQTLAGLPSNTSDFIRKYTGNKTYTAPMAETEAQLLPKGKLEHSVEDKEIPLVHISSKPGLTEIHPRFFGKGKSNVNDLQGGNKTYWFVKGSNLEGDEPILGMGGHHAYSATIPGDRIYDLTGDTDPLGYFSEINREKADDKLRAAGYRGAMIKTSDGRKVVTLYDKQPVKYEKPFQGGTAQYLPSSDPRALKSPAVWVEDDQGNVVKHWLAPIHPLAAAFAQDEGYTPTHEGWITNSGELLNREQSFDRAESLKQVPDEFIGPQRRHQKLAAQAGMVATPGLESRDFNANRTDLTPEEKDAQAWKERRAFQFIGPEGSLKEKERLGELEGDYKTFIIRHGATKLNDENPAKDRIRGHKDVPLSAEGKQEARDLGQELRSSGIQHLISSDLSRAHDTAKAVAATTGATVETDPRLRPWNFGPTIEGKVSADMAPRIQELVKNPDTKPPGGESFNQFKDRFLTAYHDAQNAHPDKTIGLVTHYRGAKLLKAWQAEGVDNDRVNATQFTNYQKGAEPTGKFDVMDKQGNPVQFAPGGEGPVKKWVDLSGLSKAEIEKIHPEAVVPKDREEKIDYEIADSPLAKQAGGGDKAVSAFADKLVDFANTVKNSSAWKSGVTWYSDFVPLLKKHYGEHAERFAQLLAATSPRNTPNINFQYANDALEMFKRGKFDAKIAKYKEGLGMLQGDEWKNWMESNKISLPKPKKAAMAKFLAEWIDRHELQPKKSNDKLYGMNSVAVLQVLADVWKSDARGLKTMQFLKNLTGEDHGATIDMWAARTMRRLGYEGLEKRWRVLPQNETGVLDKDFLFSQAAFREAASRLGMTPDALQAGLWFAEKKLWGDNGWSKQTDYGTYQKEFPKIPALNKAIEENLVAPRSTTVTQESLL
jgi:broad specificity phosphatase PhoE